MTTPTPDGQDQAADPPPAEQTGRRTVRVPVGQPDPFGQYREYVETDEEAAAHWDATRWQPWSGR